MPALKSELIARETFTHLAKRSNWAGREAGVVVVFCIVFVVACGLIGLVIHKRMAARKAAKSNF